MKDELKRKASKNRIWNGLGELVNCVLAWYLSVGNLYGNSLYVTYYTLSWKPVLMNIDVSGVMFET